MADRIGGAMQRPRLAVDQGRADAAPGALDRLLRHAIDGDDIIAINRDAVEAERLGVACAAEVGVGGAFDHEDNAQLVRGGVGQRGT